MADPACGQHGAEAREERAKGHYGYSAWDRLPLTYPGMTTQLEFEPIEFEAIRFEHRVGEVSRLQQVDPDRDKATALAFAAEFQTRATAWAMAGRATVDDGPIPWHKHPYMRVPMWVTVVLVVLGGRDIARGEPPLLTLLILLAVVPSWFVAVAMIRRGGLRRSSQSVPLNVHDISNALANRSCPDCGYGLTGVPSAIEPKRLDGVEVGPWQCPECRSKWPLVPPPAKFAPVPRGQRRTASSWTSGNG
ncbi:MAG: hypothetical protein KF699_01950 [Phycisphaeraceae bacterium]|nr:hypothetical protein [Phycisphaeraceae bacterium]MBX3405978.1 hypothetical protein [Phycisphaeraceae bacterium]